MHFKKHLLINLILYFIWQFGFSQQVKPTSKVVETLDRPKLVVGIVVDQMRYDFLYRYWSKYSEGGFKRMLREGYSFENCNYSYFPTYTGPGHASIYTGTTPSGHGIVGNNWFEKSSNKTMYCTQDDLVTCIGGTEKYGKMSPKNMKSYSIGDQILLATNFKGKSFGISIKDRGAILPAGHGANAAFWFDPETGNFISSSWYKKLNGQLPPWLQRFNEKKEALTYKNSVWNTLLPINEYTESTTDLNDYEASILKDKPPVFPYDLKLYAGKDYEIVRKTPFGNTLTADAAISLIIGENLGKDNEMDFLALSFSSTDIVGHAYGPYSIETEDTYLRLDRDLEKFFTFLDTQVGKNKYLSFLTADHGILEVPAFLENNGLPSKLFNQKVFMENIKNFSFATFDSINLVKSYMNQQVYLDEEVIKTKKLDRQVVLEKFTQFIEKQDLVHRAFAYKGAHPFPAITFQSKYEAGYFDGKSGDIQLVLLPGILDDDDSKGTSHGAPYSYDSHVPCIWFGWKILPGKHTPMINIQDIAPTLSSLLKIMEPNGSTGKPQTIPLKP